MCIFPLFNAIYLFSCRKSKCKEDVLISNPRAITAIAINPMASHQLAIGCSDSTVRIYDRRSLNIGGGKNRLHKF